MWALLLGSPEKEGVAQPALALCSGFISVAMIKHPGEKQHRGPNRLTIPSLSLSLWGVQGRHSGSWSYLQAGAEGRNAPVSCLLASAYSCFV